MIQIGSFKLATYGLLVAAGYLLGIFWLNRRRGEMGLSEDRFWGLIYALFFGAIAGGKLLYWTVEFDAILAGELRLLADIRYGFVYYGGVIGAGAMGAWYLRRHGLDFLKLADYFFTPLPLGHAVGRLGCFAAGCCAGAPTAMPWGVRFTHPESLIAHAFKGVAVHPAQLYEAGANLLIWAGLAALLGRVRSGKAPQGTVVSAYLLAYCVSRFVIEFFRGDDRGGFLAGLAPSQWIALGGAALGAWLIFARKGRGEA